MMAYMESDVTDQTQMQLSGALVHDAAENGEQLLCWQRQQPMQESFVMIKILFVVVGLPFNSTDR